MLGNHGFSQEHKAQLLGFPHSGFECLNGEQERHRVKKNHIGRITQQEMFTDTEEFFEPALQFAGH